MPVRVYDLADIPTRRGRSANAELKPYIDAVRNGKAAGDGTKYESRDAALKVAMRMVGKARRASGPGDPYPGQRVWEDRDGRWLWALVPSKRTKR
jgi:hypothetical protein